MKKNGINIIVSDEPLAEDTHLWESGELGDDPKHAMISKRGAAVYDAALGLQLMSIRLPKDLIEEFKTLGQFVGRGYQPLMRDALRFYIEHHKSAIKSATAATKKPHATRREKELA